MMPSSHEKPPECKIGNSGDMLSTLSLGVNLTSPSIRLRFYILDREVVGTQHAPSNSLKVAPLGAVQRTNASIVIGYAGDSEEEMRVISVLMRTMLVVASALLLFVACQDDNDEVAEEIDGDVIGSPQAANELEQDIEEITVAITDGEFDEDGIELIEERPTVLTVQNNDDVAYTLNIDPLVTNTEIRAGESTQIEFTTPVSAEYVSSLLPESGGDPLDTMTVEVISAIGVP